MKNEESELQELRTLVEEGVKLRWRHSVRMVNLEIRHPGRWTH